MSHRTIAIYGTCAFSGIGTWRPTWMGNEDVRDLIYDSISRFQWQGKVGASGNTTCKGMGVTWGLYHS
jgi:hypothetical protein